MNKQRKQGAILLLLCIMGVFIYFSFMTYEGFTTDNNVTVFTLCVCLIVHGSMLSACVSRVKESLLKTEMN